MVIRQIVYNGEYFVVERDILPVRMGELLVKPLSVYIGLLENLYVRYVYPSKYPVVPGSFGIVRVLEEPYSNKGYSGKIAVVNPFTSNGILGLDFNGILGSYAAIREENIYRLVNNDDPYLSLTPLIEHGVYLGKHCYGKTLIIGCNILTYIVAKFFDMNKKHDYALLCYNNRRALRRTRGRIHVNLGELDPYYDSIVILDPRFGLVHRVLTHIRSNNIIVSMYSFINLLPLKHDGTCNVLYTSKTFRGAPNMVEKMISLLKKNIRIIRINDISKTIGLLPPRGLGAIVSFRF
ncbi:hypothetical protein [Staphylothermus hellenicus]|uniref:hypothetical protein n=1 Tax=Staphylothermus hellenicus TaxID=84599 RepID=UPI0011E56314|nr:hypothetical protein [Staphylothermus hellenicus]